LPKLSAARDLPQTYRQTVPQTRPCNSKASIAKSVVGSWNCLCPISRQFTYSGDEINVSSQVGRCKWSLRLCHILCLKSHVKCNRCQLQVGQLCRKDQLVFLPSYWRFVAFRSLKIVSYDVTERSYKMIFDGHCWMGHLNHKNLSLIWPIMCLVRC